MIKLQNLTKKFGDFTAVDNINLEIKSGEFFGFLGPNGAGKTTTIKMITGLYTPTSGKIFVDGFDIQQAPVQAKLRIGYVPDEPFLYDKLTGIEYLYFSGGLYNLDKKTLTERINQMIELLELDDWIYKLTEEFSRGMRQRIAIASALLHKPKVIVIDEPIVGLDPLSASVVKKILRQKAEEGATIFMSTHLLSIAEELCDRIAIIKNGKIIFESDVQLIKELKDSHDGKLESLFIELIKEEKRENEI
ncbi:MAG: ABC transporter ATP-binding protein [Ignavibacteria bacterium]|nr:ABC transporter ATP-binding protein [Ignavibacteria bacterium]